MKNKKTIMAFSALLILIFHLWVNISNLSIEIYLKHICVIGVDLFFFVSAYSIGKRENIEYKKFIINRFYKVYLKYILFACIASLYLNYSPLKFLKTILGIELFTKGGGSFMWFIPGIMLLYITMPLYKKIDEKYPKITPIITTFGYLLITIIVSLFTNYHSIFILTNRIPIILIGYYFAKYKIFNYLNNHNLMYFIITIILIILGGTVSYLVFFNHFNVSWFNELFYILYIPLSIGLIFLLDRIKVNKLTSLISSITLELYGFQMIFGFKIANIVFYYTNIKLLSNLLTIIVLIIMSIIFQQIFNLKNRYQNCK